MQAIIFVGIGGFIGSVSRYLLSQIPINSTYPIMTMLINILGAFIIGFVSELLRERVEINTNTPLFLTSGFCGGFTTFSTFSLETLRLFQTDRHFTAIVYSCLSVITCLFAVWLGMVLARYAKV